MADTNTYTQHVVIKFTSSYTAGDNIPGVLRKVEAGWFASDEGTHFAVTKGDGTPVKIGADSDSGDIYPGTDLDNGDIKCTFDVTSGDFFVIRYGLANYREVPGT